MKAVKALFEHRNINPGREHRFDSLAQMLKHDDEWSLRVKKLDSLSPAATSYRYPTAEGRIIPPPKLELVESELPHTAVRPQLLS
jgi:HEPN domain-containing protein